MIIVTRDHIYRGPIHSVGVNMPFNAKMRPGLQEVI